MAYIKIESAEVVRHVGTRGAFAVQEYVNLPDGRSFPKTYTVWNEGVAPEVGAIVQIYGTLGVKVREYQANTLNASGVAHGGTKHAADVSVNDPTVVVLGSPKPDNTADTRDAIADIVSDTAANLQLPF